MSMAGSGPEVLTTLTTDMGKILDGIHRTKIKGTAHFSTAINIAAVSYLESYHLSTESDGCCSSP
jgi:26S proteasome regulatory subunit N10